MDVEVVYEDENLFVINKPAGIAVHKVSSTDLKETIADILVRKRPYLKDVGEDPLHPGLVHRLDKDTSGLLVIAKSQKAFMYLKQLFQTRAIKKTYLALVHGHPKSSKGTIEAPLGKLGIKQTTRTKGKRDLKERAAVTNYETIRTYGDPDVRKAESGPRPERRGYTLLKIVPQTGRTHQIRVHLKSIGCPIVGDTLYAARKPLPSGLHRMFLHAQQLAFKTPDGKALVLEVDLPEDLQNALPALQ